MEMHYATIWESIADAIPEATAVVHGSTQRTWAEFDERASRVAAAFVAAGLGPDSKIGLYLYNGNEYLEAQYGGFKMRGVPVNVNYRYLDEELAYLLENSDAEAVVFHTSLGDRIERVSDLDRCCLFPLCPHFGWSPRRRSLHPGASGTTPAHPS